MLAICLAMLETEQDQRRFTQFFKAHEKKTYAVVLHILGNPTQTENAAQQTWIKLVQNWERISALPRRETEGCAVTTFEIVKHLASSHSPWPFFAWLENAAQDSKHL